jgi:extracellular elastinolytic metalloproteinase
VLPAFVAAVVLVALLPDGGPASAAPADPGAQARPAGPADPLGEQQHAPRDQDNRTGTASPNSQQRALASRTGGSISWNPLGTPHSLGPAQQPLASGLSADPETAARQYLVQNRELFGLDEAAVTSLERLLVRPIGSGAVVTLRQHFGDLPAGHDGLVTVGVAKGEVISVSSSLSRDTSAPKAATISADQAYAAALTDAGLTAAQVASRDIRPVAVPTPTSGPRAAGTPPSRPPSPPLWTASAVRC